MLGPCWQGVPALLGVQGEGEGGAHGEDEFKIPALLCSAWQIFGLAKWLQNETRSQIETTPSHFKAELICKAGYPVFAHPSTPIDVDVQQGLARPLFSLIFILFQSGSASQWLPAADSRPPSLKLKS